MSKKSNFLRPKLTLAELGIQVMSPELLENQMQMLLMFLLILRVDQYNINEHHDELVQELHEHLVHHTHKIGKGISQTK